MIQTMPSTSHFSGLKRLIEPKAISSPRGMANASVKPKIFNVIPKPSSSDAVTDQTIASYLSISLPACAAA